MRQALKRARLDAQSLALHRQRGQLAHRRHPGVLQARNLHAGDVRDPVQVVVALPLVAAALAPTTDRAALGAIRIAFTLTLIDPRQEALLQLPVVAKVVIHVEALFAPVAENHMHALWHEPLHLAEQLGIQAQLEQEFRLARAGQFGVDDLVAVVTERRRRIHPNQKVRMADPGCDQERCLEQNLVAAMQGLAGCLRGGLVRHAIDLQVGDGPELLAEYLQVPGFMLEALALNERHLVGVLGLGQRRVEVDEVEVGQVGTGSEVDQVRGRVEPISTSPLHRNCSTSIGRVMGDRSRGILRPVSDYSVLFTSADEARRLRP